MVKKTGFYIVNILSGSRIVLSAIFLFLYLDPSVFFQKVSLFFLIIIFTSDLLDGWLARRWNVTSKLGYILDGVGDRASYIACILGICTRFQLPLLICYLIIIRDVMLYALRAIFPKWDIKIEKTRGMTKSYAILLKLIFTFFFLCSYIEIFKIYYINPAKLLLIINITKPLIYIYLLFSYYSLWNITQAYMASDQNDFGKNSNKTWQKGS
ncbi:CDP-alcohol phosphatidyltransferase family protein [Candidatus Parcubacteria bacterium]|nr:CDP-alcohol phosphatidyltransferase family protein [Candidatus Parcubacteria bacterium]